MKYRSLSVLTACRRNTIVAENKTKITIKHFDKFIINYNERPVTELLIEVRCSGE